MIQERGSRNECGDGVAWLRGSMIGKGSFGRVYLATSKNPKSRYSYYPSVMAVKSAEVSASGSIQKEREVLSNIKGCSDVIRCFGDETTVGENGVMVYNLLLEYGSGGTLAEKIRNCGGNGLDEIEAKVFAKSLLRGLSHIHRVGYVHCDLKPDNILLVPDSRNNNKGVFVTGFRAKIGDFGLAKRGEKQGKKRKLEPYLRGTPMYLSPEVVTDNVQECASDIWALGCIVLEMLTGKPPWEEWKELSGDELLRKIGEGGETPKIPDGVSKEARDFLKGCFVRNSKYRLTSEMLLNHPFVEGLEEYDGVEETEEVEDLNEIESMLLVCDSDSYSYSDSELSCGLSGDEWGVVSEEGSFYYWSEDDEEDEEYVEDEVVSGISEEREMKEEGRKGVIVSSSVDDRPKKKLREISSESTQCYPVSFTIPAGV